MVLVSKFVPIETPTRRRKLTDTDCEYNVFFDEKHGVVLDLGTTGSSSRQNAGRRSQTFQLERHAAAELLAILDAVFGDESDDADTTEPSLRGVDLNWPTDEVLNLPAPHDNRLDPGPDDAPQYTEDDNGILTRNGAESRHPRPSSTNNLNQAIEISAVEMVKRAFAKSGWELVGDRQMDGVGYDLEFERDGDLRKVEIKGMRGKELAFNVTPKEFWRAQNDPAFVVVAVTNALDERKRQAHVISRDRIVNARRDVTGYRIHPDLAR